MHRNFSLAARSALLLAVAGALIVGIYARFKGLGAAPLSVDEYYLVRSIENVVRSGLPAFSCGGYYTRGLILQYLAAGLQIAGLSAELAPRLVSALCSLLVLPAAYLLGRRSHGPEVGLLTLVMLALSVWEVEMARFGRMYAPFQPVCAWYLLFFVRYVVDRDARALWPMALLSLLAPLVWEGGALLALLNLVPMFLIEPEDRRLKANWVFFGGAVLLFVASYWFVTADFRGYNATSWPLGFSQSLAIAPKNSLTVFAPLFHQLPGHPGWIALAAVPLIATGFALRWLWHLRRRPLAAAGLLAVLAAALLHQFGAVLAITLLMLLMRLFSWKELFSRSIAPLHIAVVISGLFWLLLGTAIIDWHRNASISLSKSVAAFAYQFFSFPDFIAVVAQPWARSVPLLGLGLFILIGAVMLRQAISDEPMTAERALQVAFLVLLLAASASHPPRQETRYVYFLYPLALIIAVTGIARAAEYVFRRRRTAVTAAALLSLGGFAMSEDFQPHHLLYIDAPVEIFRSNMNLNMQGHLEIRNDYREMARWLQQHVSRDRDLVINGVHGLDYYYPAVNFFFADERDPDFPSWSCQHGTVERWGNYPLIYSVNLLKARIAASHDTYMIFYPTNNPGLLQALTDYAPRIVWSQGYVSIAVLHGSR